MEKVLFLERRGCIIRESKPENIDLNNYRYVSRIVDTYGRDLFIEVTRGEKIRFTNSRTGAQLKKPVHVHGWKLHISAQYENMNGCFADLQIERDIWNNDYYFNSSDVLKAVNSISKDVYTSVIECDILPENLGFMPMLPKAEKTAFLEKIGKAAADLPARALDTISAYRFSDDNTSVTVYYNGNYASAETVSLNPHKMTAKKALGRHYLHAAHIAGYRENDIMLNLETAETIKEGDYTIIRLTSTSGASCEYCLERRTFTN